MNELVERIAKAIFQADPWTQHSYESHHAFYVEMARAALREVEQEAGSLTEWCCGSVKTHLNARISELEHEVRQLAETHMYCDGLIGTEQTKVQELERQVAQAELETQRWVTAWGEVKRETEWLRHAFMKESDEVEQVLGKALGYPWFKDDQRNFPGATEANGVCVGEHVPGSIAAEAANRIKKLEMERMDHPLARISDWLGKRVTDLEAGLLEALPYVEATHAGSGLADRLRALLVEKK